MKYIFLTTIVSLWLNFGFTQNNSIPTSNTQSLENIQVPQFSDPEIHNFFTLYQNNLINYLKAVRQNNKPAIKAAFDKDVSNFDKIFKTIEKTKSIPAEHKKALDYLTQTKPYITKMGQHPYVKELSKEYLKNYEKK